MDDNVAEESVKENTPSSNDADDLRGQFGLMGSNQNSNAVGYWYPQTNVFGKPETVCFGRLACSNAYAHLLEHPDDVAGAKKIAATYCLIHTDACAKDARVWERTEELGEEFVMALGTGTGRLIGGRLSKSGTCTKCFLAGTDVLMADGTTKDIEDVEPGDKVQATDPETGETGTREVTRLIITEDDKHFNELSIATDDGIEKLTATNEHPFWSPSEDDWIETGDLGPGMTLLTDDGTTVIVTANRAYTKHATTYNLTVDDLHTYYVLAGDTPVLVHNSGCPTFNYGVAPDFRGIYIITMKDGRAYVGSAGKLPTSTVHKRLHKAFTDKEAAVYQAGYTYDDVAFVATRDMSGKSWTEIRQAEQVAIDGLGGVGGGTLLNRRNEG
ncbi:HINT domain-containing protein [Streptomyces sp. NBC_00019]